MSTPTDIKNAMDPQVIDDLLGAEPDLEPDPKPEPQPEPQPKPDPGKKADCVDYGCGH
ncbi:hypothetical protein SAMN05421504_10860 [Amycolatopsis xylanica]|uniref:Uncharacterized protein n=1 Tax=Amycolatopsis xylanica TaxID=589385 RepID=A0A1H3P7I3_9PSEU|nr:hypothetical protein [Amycolatopsis xylanica]SDY97066.1 hypothetical protein SAMN05421504_10860 [Amycolatopsis xylanica]